MGKDTRQRLLALMVARVGRPELAARFGVPLGILDDWIAGHARLPDGKLISLIDLIDETGDGRACG
jgi:hypothetical protein